MYWPCSSTLWMRASISAFSTRYCAFRSVNSIAPYLSLQFLDFLLHRLVLLQLALQEPRGGADFLASTLRRQVVGVGELVVAVAEVLHFDQAAREQCTQA